MVNSIGKNIANTILIFSLTSILLACNNSNSKTLSQNSPTSASTIWDVNNVNESEILLNKSLAQFVYILDNKGEAIYMYHAESDGLLTALTPESIATGPNPFAITVDPSSYYVYVPNADDNTVSSYHINRDTGILSLIATTPTGTDYPTSVTISTDSKYAYITNYADSSISKFVIKSNGALSEIASHVFHTIVNPYTISKNPNRQFFYVASDNLANDATNIQIFSVNESGDLKEESTIKAGIDPYILTMSPSGITFYAGSMYNANGRNTNNNISAFQVESSNLLLSSTANGGDISQISITPNNQYLYTSDMYNNQINLFRVNLSNGNLVPLPNKENISTSNFAPSDMMIDSTGKFLYVISNWNGQAVNSVSTYLIDELGILTLTHTPQLIMENGVHSADALAIVAIKPAIMTEIAPPPRSILEDPVSEIVLGVSGVDINKLKPEDFKVTVETKATTEFINSANEVSIVSTIAVAGIAILAVNQFSLLLNMPVTTNKNSRVRVVYVGAGALATKIIAPKKGWTFDLHKPNSMVTIISPKPGKPIGAYGPLEFKFGMDLDPDSVKANFKVYDKTTESPITTGLMNCCGGDTRVGVYTPGEALPIGHNINFQLNNVIAVDQTQQNLANDVAFNQDIEVENEDRVDLALIYENTNNNQGFTGNIGTLAYMDQLCNEANIDRPLDTPGYTRKIFKAMIASGYQDLWPTNWGRWPCTQPEFGNLPLCYGWTQRNWRILRNEPYYAAYSDLNNEYVEIGVSNDYGIFPANSEGNIFSHPIRDPNIVNNETRTYYEAHPYAWSGLTTNWTLANGATCGNWLSNSAENVGMVSDPSKISTRAISIPQNLQSCDQHYSLICIQVNRPIRLTNSISPGVQSEYDVEDER